METEKRQEEFTLRILGIYRETIVDGEGLRYSIYFSGCSHACPGCHNQESWNPCNGDILTYERLEKIAEEINSNELLDGITVSGGDPLFNPVEMFKVLKFLKAKTGKNIWLYTGYTIEQLREDELRKKLIEQAAPPGVRAHVIPLDKLVEVSKDPRFGNTKALLLFENPQDALYVIERGVDIKELNVGSMAHTVGKVMVNNVLSMDQNDVDTYKKLRDLGVQFDVRKVAADKRADLFKLISEKQNEGLKL